MGAQSHVRVSFDSPEYTVDSVAMWERYAYWKQFGTISNAPELKYGSFQAGSSEMFGLVQEVPKRKQHHFIRVVPTPVPRFTLTGRQSTIENPIICLPVMAF